MKRSLATSMATAMLCVAVSSPLQAGSLFSKLAPKPKAIYVSADTPASALAQTWKSMTQRVTTPPGNVIISNFRVIVLTDVAGSGSVTPGFTNPDGGSASISAFYTLNGIDKEALQAVVTQAHAQLQEELKASGYNVLPRSTLDGVKGSEHVVGDGSVPHVQFVSAQNGASSGYMFTPADMPARLPMGAKVLAEGKGTSDANGKSLGRLFSGAAAASGAGRGQFVSTEVASRVGATDTVIQVFRPKMGNNGMLALQSPLVAQGMAFSDVRETTTRGDKAGAVTGAVLSGLLALGTGAGGMSVHQTKRYEVTPTAEHPQILGDALKAANRSVAGAIAQ